MKSKSDKLMDIIDSVLKGKQGRHIPRWLIEFLDIQTISLKKVRDKNEYDIVVSINSLESSLTGIRDVIEYACSKEDINYRKIYIEI